MKLINALGLAFLFVVSEPCYAQKTTGDIISENWQRGREMREAMEARKTEEQEPIKYESPRPNPVPGKAFPTDTFIFFLNSTNGIPRIVVTAFTPTRCGKPWKMAATLDKNGEAVTGCIKIEPGKSTFTVDWDNYGIRTYSVSEWVAEVRGEADQKALGE